MQSGEAIPSVVQNWNPDETGVFEAEYQGIPEGVKKIRLRPVYSISGARPEENVVLKLK